MSASSRWRRSYGCFCEVGPGVGGRVEDVYVIELDCTRSAIKRLTIKNGEHTKGKKGQGNYERFLTERSLQGQAIAALDIETIVKASKSYTIAWRC